MFTSTMVGNYHVHPVFTAILCSGLKNPIVLVETLLAMPTAKHDDISREQWQAKSQDDPPKRQQLRRGRWWSWGWQ